MARDRGLPAPVPLDADVAGDPFAALGDGSRRAILRLLGDGERTVGELARELPISRPAVSRHLRLLREAGLVTEESRGTRRLYRLHDDGLDAVEAYLREVWGSAATRFRLAAENVDPLERGRARPASTRASARPTRRRA